MTNDRSIQPCPAPTESAAPHCYTVAPGVDTPIALTTLPHAVCWVHAESDSDPRHSLKAYADGEGVVRFHVQPATHNIATDDIARLEVACVAKGNIVRYPLHLRVGIEPTAEMPSPPVEKPCSVPKSIR